MKKSFKLFQQKEFGQIQKDKRIIFFKKDNVSAIGRKDIHDYYKVTVDREYNFKSDTIEEILEEIFYIYNMECSKVGHRGYSMSAGDIVYIDGKFYITCSMGFQEICSLEEETVNE